MFSIGHRLACCTSRRFHMGATELPNKLEYTASDLTAREDQAHSKKMEYDKTSEHRHSVRKFYIFLYGYASATAVPHGVERSRGGKRRGR